MTKKTTLSRADYMRLLALSKKDAEIYYADSNYDGLTGAGFAKKQPHETHSGRRIVTIKAEGQAYLAEYPVAPKLVISASGSFIMRHILGLPDQQFNAPSFWGHSLPGTMVSFKSLVVTGALSKVADRPGWYTVSEEGMAAFLLTEAGRYYVADNKSQTSKAAIDEAFAELTLDQSQPRSWMLKKHSDLAFEMGDKNYGSNLLSESLSAATVERVARTYLTGVSFQDMSAHETTLQNIDLGYGIKVSKQSSFTDQPDGLAKRLWEVNFRQIQHDISYNATARQMRSMALELAQALSNAVKVADRLNAAEE